MKATIITIGDEILIGQIVDTNSVSIARKLNAIGIAIREKLSIGDSRDQIVNTLSRTLKTSDVLIITGGLGPTKDCEVNSDSSSLGLHVDECNVVFWEHRMRYTSHLDLDRTII